jgi:serine phosphatase RsbU (regulator of sigma subunit)
VTQVLFDNTLLFLTDGATEFQDGTGTPLGSDGLSRFVQAQINGNSSTELSLNKLAEQLLKHCHSLRLPDDVTLIKLTRRFDVGDSIR